MGFCENPCDIDKICAKNALCHTKMHRPICQCPEGHGGNPTINCTPIVTCKNMFFVNNAT